MKRLRDIKVKSGLAGLYSVLAFMVFWVVGFLAFWQSTGNGIFLVSSITTLIGFLVLLLKVHFKHRGTVYDLEDLK